MTKSSPLLSAYWYVLYTYPHYEKKVYNELSRDNTPCYLPLQRTEKKWSDRKKVMEVPLFPNYIFVKTYPAERFHILNIHGVSKFINLNGQPVIIKEREIESIKQLSLKTDLSVENTICRGDAVRIQDGLFSGLEGIIFAKKGKQRFCIKIESINQYISVELGNESLIKI